MQKSTENAGFDANQDLPKKEYLHYFRSPSTKTDKNTRNYQYWMKHDYFNQSQCAKMNRTTYFCINQKCRPLSHVTSN